MIARISLIGLLTVLAASCSRMSADLEAEVRQSFGVPADVPLKDLGAVKLHAGTPRRMRVGPGEDCTITATVLTNGLVQLSLLYESEGGVVGGVKTQPHSERSQLVFRPETVSDGWRLCLPQMGRPFVVAMQPIIVSAGGAGQ